MDLRIQIRTKMSWIRNNEMNAYNISADIKTDEVETLVTKMLFQAQTENKK
jgi:hypothetical protein